MRTPWVRAGRRALKAIVAGAAALSLGSCASSGPTTGGGASSFELEIRWLGTPPSGVTRSAFEAAFTIVRETIIAPLPPVDIPSNFTDLGACGGSWTGQPPVPQETIQGLIVYLLVAPIDGAGGTLGSAGPCLVRDASERSLTALGVMHFDAVDVAAMPADRLTSVVLHELMHVLGFGTIWTENDLLGGDGTADARFLGPRARVACATVHAGGAACAESVPVHSTDGVGSAYAHWRESLFTNELMTPFLGAGAAPFSTMTTESLGDLGYTVSGVHTAAFTVSGTALRLADDPSDLPVIQFSEPLQPSFTIDVAGKLVPYRRVR